MRHPTTWRERVASPVGAERLLPRRAPQRRLHNGGPYRFGDHLAGCEGWHGAISVAYNTNVAGGFEVFSPLFLRPAKVRCPGRSAVGGCQAWHLQNVRGAGETARIFKGAQDISPEDHLDAGRSQNM